VKHSAIGVRDVGAGRAAAHNYFALRQRSLQTWKNVCIEIATFLKLLLSVLGRFRYKWDENCIRCVCLFLREVKV